MHNYIQRGPYKVKNMFGVATEEKVKNNSFA